MIKAAFFDIQDKQGRIQCYVRRDDIGTEEYKWFKTYDIGDIMNWGGLMEKMIPAWNKETPDFTSLWTKNQAKAETALQKTIDLYSEIG